MSEPLPISGQPMAIRVAETSAAAVEPVHLLGLSLEEMRAWLVSLGEPAFRAGQLAEWIYERGATSFEEMTNLSKRLRTTLAERAVIFRLHVERETAAADGTRKLLLRAPDGAAVETVWIPSSDRHTVCVSSQVGCPVGCRFCASGLEGVERNLSAGEIVEQAMHVRRLVAAHGAPVARTGPGMTEAIQPARLSNVVLMGMGEPLANYEAVMKAIRILNAEWGVGIGARKITLSTVGLPAQIRRLAGENLQINLALSLHSPDDELRRELIPWGRGVPIASLVEACEHYFRVSGREITLEYVLLEGVNMQPGHAVKLAGIARRLRANVNLLRYNPVPGVAYERPSAEAAFKFQRLLRERGVNAHVRTSRGKDAQAACGQLRRAAGGAAPAAAQGDSTSS